MARKPIIPIRADAETKARWEKAAAASMTSLSEFVRAAVEEKIERGVEPPVLRTKSGRVLTDADIEALADEAERGYDPATLTARCPPKPSDSLRAVVPAVVGGKVFKGPDPKGGKQKK